MTSNYRVVILITFFLLVLSIGSSVSYYLISLNSTEKQLKTQSLPLSLDNIYTDIQKHIIEPYLVSSMMANDTFMHDWIKNEEDNSQKIQKYLESIKTKYGMLVTFLVSQKSQNYYTQDGLIEKVLRTNPTNAWYFKFKDIQAKHEINLDLNENITDSIIMFINFKILDVNSNFLGATGVGIKIEYIHEMLKMFKKKYKLKVMFLDKDGNVILSEGQDYNSIENISSIKEYEEIKKQILSQTTSQLEYVSQGSTYILNTKYIKELDIHLLVEARVDDFTQSTRNNFYINLAISLILTLIIATIITNIIKKHNKNLEKIAEFDTLTNMPNRHNFTTTLNRYISITNRSRDPLSLLFIDIDDFKNVNDRYGHNVGDKVLVAFADILKAHTRDEDICARWGGEEFVIGFLNTDLTAAAAIADKLRLLLQNSEKLQKLLGKEVTISAGVTSYVNTDTLDSLILRADNAMYKAKNNGKNCIKLDK